MTQQMSSRERILASLHSKETDRLAWAPLVDDYFISSIAHQGYHSDIIATTRDVIACDFIERHVASPIERFKNVTCNIQTENGTVRTVYETPVGSIFQEEKFSGNTKYVAKHFVETVEDIKVYTWICANTFYDADIKRFLAREKEISDVGIATIDGNMSPIQELLQYKSGVENTVYLQMDYPNEMEELLSVMHERNLRQYQVAAQYPTEVVFDYEDTSTTVMSRTMFEQYSLPAINAYTKILKESGKLFITHMCGKLTGFADLIARGEQDGIDSVCPPNTGDLCAWNARKAWGNKKVVIGGIDPPSLVMLKPEEILQNVAEVLRRVDNKRGFILSTGDAVSYGTPMENLCVVSRLLKELGENSLGNEVPEIVLQKILRNK